MTLFGALTTGVSGLNAQGQKIGIISDNIANANTVGYKEAEAQFETLVLTQGNQVAFSPGGVRNNTRLNVDKQGTIESTASATDIAISGDGFFTVSAAADGTGQDLYTRAGSFRQDSRGNLVNSQGFFLQGWPLDREGRLPGEPGNINTTSFANPQSLQTVNIDDASGIAQATTGVDVGVNLDAGQDVLDGAGATADLDINSSTNFNIDANTIIVPDEGTGGAAFPDFGLSTPNNIVRGDQFSITTGNGLDFDYQYGGFTMGRQATNSNLAENIGDAGNDLSPTVLAGGGEISTAAGSNIATVDLSGAGGLPAGLAPGDQVNLGNVTFPPPGPGVPLAEFNGLVTVSAVNPGPDTFEFTLSANATPPGVSSNANATFSTRIFEGNIFDANSANEPFFQGTSLSLFTDQARSFTISNASVQDGTATFTYTSSSPNTTAGEFNSLGTLAEAIDSTGGLTARVVDGRLVVGAADANESVTFANVDAAGSGGLDGLDWVSELDLQDVGSGARRFSTLGNLADVVDDDQGLSGVVSNPLAEASLDIRTDDPLGTIRFQDFLGPLQPLPNDPATAVAGPPGFVDVTFNQPGHTFNVGDNVQLSGLTGFSGITAAELNTSATIIGTNPGADFTVRLATGAGGPGGPGGGNAGQVQQANVGSVLGELGIVDSLNSGPYIRGDTGDLGPVYDSAGVNGSNMTSGDITPQFSRATTVFDAQGTGHELNIAYAKTGENQWAVEVFAIDETEVATTGPNGQIAAGEIIFNGDASLQSVSSALTGDIEIQWTNGAEPSQIEFDWGTAGLPFGTPGATQFGDTDGLSQFDGDYNVRFLNQNGAPVGDLTSVSIDDEGFVIASFSNGEDQSLFKLPLADFNNPNGLEAISGNVFAQTAASGDLNLREAGSPGVGEVISGAVESSNVDLAEQLTDLIVAQRTYQSNTRTISTSDELLELLTQI